MEIRPLVLGILKSPQKVDNRTNRVEVVDGQNLVDALLQLMVRISVRWSLR